MAKSNKIFDKSEVESRFTGEDKYSDINIPQVFTGDDNSFVDSLSSELLKQLDIISIIANKQILSKTDWASFADQSGNNNAELIAALQAQLATLQDELSSLQQSLMQQTASHQTDVQLLTESINSDQVTKASKQEEVSTKNSEVASLQGQNIQLNRSIKNANKAKSSFINTKSQLLGDKSGIESIISELLSNSDLFPLVIPEYLTQVKNGLETLIADANSGVYESDSQLSAAIDTFSNSSFIINNNFVLYPDSEGNGSTIYGSLYGILGQSFVNMKSSLNGILNGVNTLISLGQIWKNGQLTTFGYSSSNMLSPIIGYSPYNGTRSLSISESQSMTVGEFLTELGNELSIRISNIGVSYTTTEVLSYGTTQLGILVSALTSEIDLITGYIYAATTDIDGYQSQIAQYQADISTKQAQIAQLNAEIQTLNANIASLESDLAQGQATFNAFQSQAQDNISTKQAQIAQLQNEIAALQQS